MPTDSRCSHCEPPGSGACSECRGAETTATAVCRACYGARICRHCKGTGFEQTALLWLWWISWLGIIPGFLFVGLWEYRIEVSAKRSTSQFSLTLLATSTLLWILFFVCDHQARAKAGQKTNWKALVALSTVAGTILAIYTLMGIAYFVFIAPQVR
jgi:cation transport ATPase